MFIKTILQGRMEFGNIKSYQKVVKMFEYRTETYYKSDIIVKLEDIFDDKVLSLEIPRYVGQHLDKSYRNTVSLLEYCAQFAISGEIRAWQTDRGTVLSYVYIEPQSDKAAVTYFIKGKKLVGEDGREEEALTALSNAIEKYNRHAYAYLKRAEVNYMLKKFHDSLRDFNKCLAIDDSIPDAYLGRANIAIQNEDYQEAIDNLELALKKSIALQHIYWKSRRLKADCHLKLEQYEKAAYDLKLFTNRKFDDENPNKKFVLAAKKTYLDTLMKTESYAELLELLLKIDELPPELAKNAGLYHYYRGVSKHKIGKKGHLKDLKQAVSLDSKEAAAYLKSIK